MNKVKYLLTYRYAEIIHDLTVEFTRVYILSYLSSLRVLGGLSKERKPDYRTADKMNQAARGTNISRLLFIRKIPMMW